MTSLVDVSEIFGMGIPVKRRLTWSGTVRRNRALIGGRKDTWTTRLRAPSAVSVFTAIANNGTDMYVVAGSSSNQVYTSPDLYTFTARSTVGTIAAGGCEITAFQGDFWLSRHTGTTTGALDRSTDKGVTWAAAPTPNPGSAVGVPTLASVVGGVLYLVANFGTATFYNTPATGTAPTSRAFSRTRTWGRVFGGTARRFSLGSSNPSTIVQDSIEVSTDGNSFAQDTAGEALLARMPSASTAIRNGFGTGNGKAVVFQITTAGFYSILCDQATGVWSMGTRMPNSVPGGFPGEKFFSAALYSTSHPNPASYMDSDGITYIPFLTVDGDGVYRYRVMSTYDGVDYNILPVSWDFGTTAPTNVMPRGSLISGYLITAPDNSVLVEANPDAVELVYEV